MAGAGEQYTAALHRYLALRQKITVQNHTELPRTGGILDRAVLDATVIEPGQQRPGRNRRTGGLMRSGRYVVVRYVVVLVRGIRCRG
jgi:hypothetical protein